MESIHNTIDPAKVFGINFPKTLNFLRLFLY